MDILRISTPSLANVVACCSSTTTAATRIVVGIEQLCMQLVICRLQRSLIVCASDRSTRSKLPLALKAI
jgi:hypothetical protein